MSGLKLAEGEWIVVCDGAKALLLENIGDSKFPNLKILSVRQHEDALTREQGAERPGRVHASAGTARSSVEQTDWHERSEEQFLKGLVADLASHAEYTDKLKTVLKNEVPHDYVKKPVPEIERLLTA
jgi:protein required for attachment to host cells